ncbi:hydrolase [bacterium]|nr:hydrolase [bacterium]
MLEIQNTTLVIIDIQGKLAEIAYDSERMIDNVKRLIKGMKVLEVPIILTEQLPDKLGGTKPEIAELLTDIEPIVKNTFSCCGEPKFIEKLKESGRRQVLLCGIESHVCVYQTACDLVESGYEVYVVTDAVSSRTRENRKMGLTKMKDIGAGWTSMEMALFELLKVAEGEKFRRIIRIVK